MRLTVLLMLSAFVFLCGCDEPSTSSVSKPTSSAGPAPPPEVSDEPVQQLPAVEIVDSDSNLAGANGDESSDEYDRTKAEVGVGKKGRNYGGGVISEPIRQYFRAEQRIHLLNMERALKMYKAEHDKFPKSHDEFMEKIIKVNDIQLPELPDGERYAFDAETGTLMVERPRR